MKDSCVYTTLLALGLADGAGCTVNHCDYYPAHCATLDDVAESSSSDEATESESESESETGWFDLPSETESTDDTTTGNEPECTMSSECAQHEPICQDGVCVPCSEHEQCSDSACNVATGECMPSDRVWWVDRSAGPEGDGT